jgi:hypothetical protein
MKSPKIDKKKSDIKWNNWKNCFDAGGGGALMDNIFQCLISCIIIKRWTEKLNISTVANILKISVRGFFANLIICP